MRTYVIRLQKYDDLLTIQDKITWSNTTRVILVFPDDKKPVSSQVDMERLYRFAADHGYQLGAVIKNEELRCEAQQAGLIVFESLEKANKFAWKRSKPVRKDPRNKPAPVTINRFERITAIQTKKTTGKTDTLDKPNLMAGLLIIAVGLVLLLLFFGPTVKIYVQPEHQQHIVDFSISASPNNQSIYSGSGIPARIVKAAIEDAGSEKPSGETKIPDTYAEGTVLIKNTSNERVSIPVGTVVLSPEDPSKRYVTLNDVLLDPKNDPIVMVAVRAVSPGSEFNINAAQVTGIEKEFGLMVEVVNEEAIKGGSDKVVAAISDADIVRLKNRLIQSMQLAAVSQINQQLKPGEMLVDSMVELTKVDSENYNYQAGQVADELTLAVNAEFSGWVIKKSDLESIASMIIKTKIPEGDEVFPGSLSLETLTPPIISDSKITWQVRAVQESRKSLPLSTIKENLRGQWITTAGEELAKKYALVNPPVIEAFPPFWPIMPFYFMRIDIEVR